MPWLCPACAMPHTRKAQLRPSVPCQDDPPNPAPCVLNCNAHAVDYFAAVAVIRAGGRADGVKHKAVIDPSSRSSALMTVLGHLSLLRLEPRRVSSLWANTWRRYGVGLMRPHSSAKLCSELDQIDTPVASNAAISVGRNGSSCAK